MFAYPDDALYIGRPVADIIRFNAERGLFSGESMTSEVEKRLAYLRQGSAYKYQRCTMMAACLKCKVTHCPVAAL